MYDSFFWNSPRNLLRYSFLQKIPANISLTVFLRNSSVSFSFCIFKRSNNNFSRCFLWISLPSFLLYHFRNHFESIFFVLTLQGNFFGNASGIFCTNLLRNFFGKFETNIFSNSFPSRNFSDSSIGNSVTSTIFFLRSSCIFFRNSLENFRKKSLTWKNAKFCENIFSYLQGILPQGII